MKVIVIGGVAAGMSAASKISRVDKSAEVVVYEKNGFLSYGACGLPYYVGGFNDDYRRMIARTREEFTSMGIKTFLKHEVQRVDFASKTVYVKDLETGRTFEDRYDKLMISTGAASVMPPFEGRELLGVHTLKTMEDGIFLKELAKLPQIKNVVVVGGGYIGIECADAFVHLGKKVRIIEAADRILTTFDEEMAEEAKKELLNSGVELCTGEKVKNFAGNEYVSSVETDRGVYPADLVIVAVGVRPSTGFLKDTGIKLAGNGAIIVNRRLETSVPDVYAAGDCILVYNKETGDDSFYALGTVANKCGRIAGANICGAGLEFTGALGSSAIKVMNIEMGRTGLGEAEAAKRGLNYGTVLVKAYDHPAYYPDPTPILIKLVYEKGTKKLLGAQACGRKGAVMRIDIFAVAIHNGMTTEELGMTDLVYAPPFAGVWDAVHIACNAAK
ncbi:MAG: CoA-disulfide reductase [Lachnospiraceae bacterium]|nr:CoA-disulfide reductase [Lachnospiraceae bacterium]